ncbi:DinB family protein [Aneurinibacillus sp. Ricciae_BoGa-3]|uniref:DinB family protein n=1 Tax=Aneurinibacillus sp. Ricciae_BoGa-3 TaxID=3022697 RepID=UPI002FEE463C
MNLSSFVGESSTTVNLSGKITSTYVKIRQFTEQLVKPLETEDFVIQSMEDVSPPKWHLAHTTWFFETFVLKPHLKNFKEFNPAFSYLFNSYYETVGTFFRAIPVVTSLVPLYLKFLHTENLWMNICLIL